MTKIHRQILSTLVNMDCWILMAIDFLCAAANILVCFAFINIALLVTEL